MNHLSPLLGILWGFLVPSMLTAAPVINEFSADTAATGLTDEDGDTEDWIEIFNPGPGSVDLSTFHLTDDAGELRKWSFPPVTLASGDYLVVFSSSKNRTNPGSELHTNFKLSANGEYLALTQSGIGAETTIITEFAPNYPPQEEGVSYGFNQDRTQQGYFSSPSPDAANGPITLGSVQDTVFSINRGFYTEPIAVEISSATQDAVIRYTLDGSVPTATRGFIYSGPVSISSTTILRAAAFKNGLSPTNVDTHSYLFLDDVRTQHSNGNAPSGWPDDEPNGQEFNYGMDPEITNRYSSSEMIAALSAIPSVSISTTQSNLTSSSTGIYVNPGSRGRSWERPASVEFLHPDGTKSDVQSECGLRIRGGFSRSRSNPKHAFRLFFREDYGDGKLNYPLFGAEGAEEFDKLDFRTSQNYSWAFQGDGSNTFLREVLGRDLQGSIGQPYTRSRYYHLYLNGIYWGLYMSQERAEANYGELYFGGDDKDYDTIKSAGSSGGYDTEATDGSMEVGSDWHKLWQFARAQEASPTMTRFMEMQGRNIDGSRNPSLPVYLDVDNLIDYHLLIGYTGNYDGPLSDFVGASNNWYSVRNRETDDLGFQFFVHDGEHSMGAGGRWNGANDRLNTSNGSGSRRDLDKSNPSFVHFDLAEGTGEYRLRFADRAHHAIFNDGLLTPVQVQAQMDSRRQTVAEVIIAESARWGDSKRSSPRDEEDWESAVNSLSSEINQRTTDFLEHLRDADLYPSLPAPTYLQHGGTVSAGSTLDVAVPNTATQLFYVIGTGNPEDDLWNDQLDPRRLGGSLNPEASVVPIVGGGGGVRETDFVSSGDIWKYLDDGSNQGTAWRESSFNDSTWKSGPSELGYGDDDEATEIESGPDNNKYPTSYFRKSVTIPDPSIFGDFELEITYDDSYVVYLNGSEIARHSGLPSNPAFDLYANNIVSNNAVDQIILSKTDFRSGSNVIAVEIHQGNETSSDVSFDLELTGRPPGGVNSQTVTLPDVITEPIWIKSRSFDSTTETWSALNQAFFTTARPAAPADLVISEVHYHPASPTPAELAINPGLDQDDFEFIEIMNIGTETIDLGEVRLIRIQVGDHLEGVTSSFPQGTLIQPNQRLVIVADSAAFAIRYPGISIAGDYSQRLSNTGEWITLVDSEDDIIDQFRYNDKSPWPVDADGTGVSLVRIAPGAKSDPTLAANWETSPDSGGSPGNSDAEGGFVGDPLADLDGDGYPAIVEYAQGLSDEVYSAGQHLSLTQVSVGGSDFLEISFREDPSAIGVKLEIFTSPDLQDASWSEFSFGVTLHRTENDPDGIPRHFYRTKSTLEEIPSKFYRLNVTY